MPIILLLAIISIVLGTVFALHLINETRLGRESGLRLRIPDTKFELALYFIAAGILFIFAYFFIINE